MAIHLETEPDSIRIVDLAGELTPAIKSALRLKGFSRQGDVYTVEHLGGGDQIDFVLNLLNSTGINADIDTATREILGRRKYALNQLAESQQRGRAIKQGSIDDPTTNEFIYFSRNKLKRRLLPHQVKAGLHLVDLAHGANFSVPGSGKTSVVLATYEFLRKKGEVNFLFVVGPRSCFMAWRTEFELVLGRKAKVEIVAGGNIHDRRQRYFRGTKDNVELYLTTYHTLARDKKQVQHLLRNRASRAFFVIDEAHYMKQDEGVWAKAVAETSRNAVKRCVLTGTPFPKSYADGINLFDVLYPNSGIFSTKVKVQIRHASEAGQHHIARKLLEPAIDGLYYRVRKNDLHLSDPVFLTPIQIEMNPIEREIYDCIERRIGELEDVTTDLDLETIIRLKKGRQIRRLQAVSYSALLFSAIAGYTEVLIDSENDPLSGKISNYDEIEIPAKMQRLLLEVQHLCDHGEKVVIWANFVGTLHRIKKLFDEAHLNSQVVFGGTPTEEGTGDDSRDEIIEKFKNNNSGLDILIANPAACAESVSLHKTCSNAIYYDLSYNCAQYLQSLDRIHRVGGSEKKVSYYRFLQYADTFEHEIINNLFEKADRMADVIDQEFPLALSELPDWEVGDDEPIN